jgi:signal peptidase II
LPNQGLRLPSNRYALFFILAAIGAVADLLTKSMVFDRHFQPQLLYLGQHQPIRWWIDGVFGIQCSTNPGALFGFAKGYSPVFAVISILAITGILVWLFWFKHAVDRWLTIAFGLVTGGILGNLYDRLGLGYRAEYPVEIKTDVRDWILFRLQGVPMFDPWPNFNIADSLLVTGAIMLFVHAFFFSPGNPSVMDKSA